MMTTTPVMTITNEQIAEIEALATRFPTQNKTVLLFVDEVIAIISRLRAAERDAERYRWLRNDALNIPGWAPAAVITDGAMIQQCLEGRDLDEEIDAAMEQSK